ncbi:MAG: sulfotransferase [Alphaproteobacteria bacterium]|nr:MAG: sulfotransferase [Alphaproteobacteria bacterium]
MVRNFVKEVVRGVFARLEPLALPRATDPKYPPLFIVGPPRAGTTLLYLLVTHRFRVSYISNLLAMTPRSPVLLARLAKPFRPLDGPESFFSHYGETRGWRGPNQGYRIWNEWLPTDIDYIAPGNIPLDVRRRLRQIVAGIEAINDGPFVNKWQRNAARIDALHDLFPEALFLRVTRNHEQVAQSLLKGRVELNGDPGCWFSVRPLDIPDSGSLSPIEQVCYQAVGMDRQIAKDLARLGTDRSHTVNYEDLCADTAGELAKLADWYAERTGHRLRVDNVTLPTLIASTNTKVGEREAAEIAALCARIEAGEVAV